MPILPTKTAPGTPLDRACSTRFPRRQLLKAVSVLGVTSTVFGRALVALAEEQTRVTPDMIKNAEWVSGLSLTDEKRNLMAKGLNETLAEYDKLRDVPLDNAVPPALSFHPAPERPADVWQTHNPARPIESAAAQRPTTTWPSLLSPHWHRYSAPVRFPPSS